MFSRVFPVILPPEKAEGCESYQQRLHLEDGDKVALRDAAKASGKKRISLNVVMTWKCFVLSNNNSIRESFTSL